MSASPSITGRRHRIFSPRRRNTRRWSRPTRRIRACPLTSIEQMPSATKNTSRRRSRRWPTIARNLQRCTSGWHRKHPSNCRKPENNALNHSTAGPGLNGLMAQQESHKEISMKRAFSILFVLSLAVVMTAATLAQTPSAQQPRPEHLSRHQIKTMIATARTPE
jgi:hypothetical protein